MADDIDSPPEEEYEDDFFFDDEYKGERLFFIAAGLYVQYSGKGDYPPEVKQWMDTNNGDLPPFMPLPAREVEFHVDEECAGRYTIPWPGHGRLPEAVLHYVEQHGVLPRNTAIHHDL